MPGLALLQAAAWRLEHGMVLERTVDEVLMA
jgi:hypothetical protein